MAVIFFINKLSEQYVPECFKTRMFKEAYNHYVYPLNGMKMWPTTNYKNPLPPKPRKMPGRPKKRRGRDVSEGAGRNSTSRKVRKVGAKMVCTNCKEVGHNKRTCKQIVQTDNGGQKGAKGGQSNAAGDKEDNIDLRELRETFGSHLQELTDFELDMHICNDPPSNNSGNGR